MKNDAVSEAISYVLIDIAEQALQAPRLGPIDLSLPSQIRTDQDPEYEFVWRNIANGWLQQLRRELTDRGYHVEEHVYSDTPLTVGPDILTILVGHFTIQIRRAAVRREDSPFVLVTSSPTDGDKDRWASSPSRSVTSREAIMYLDGLRLGVQG